MKTATAPAGQPAGAASFLKKFSFLDNKMALFGIYINEKSLQLSKKSAIFVDCIMSG
ncbi:MAG: hypothetical protein IK010_07080 [Bacteroidales bacterium]|nr:hypothetical protein [Bacteroidales bacterium]